MSKVLSFEYVDEPQQTYDLEVDHLDHQFFLSNGVLTSNSHAVAYAYDSYFCAWLFYYYPQEWICAWLESAESDPDEKSKAISLVKSFGYEIDKFDVNHSQRNWTYVDKKIIPSFKSIKGVGDSAIDELLANRPYHSIQDFLWDSDGKWKHSKLNKRCFDVLTKLEAFDSLSIVGENKEIKNYKQLNFLLVEKASELKKKGSDILPSLIEEAQFLSDWTPQEKTSFFSELAGIVAVDNIVSEEIQEKLRENGILPMSEFLETAEKGDPGIVWFILSDYSPKTTKNGKEYMLFITNDSTNNKQRLFVWGAKHSNVYEKNSLYLCEIKKGDFLSTTNWTLKKVD